jgi:hypothetical protein
MGKKSRKKGTTDKDKNKKQAAAQPGRKSYKPWIVAVAVVAVIGGYFLVSGESGPNRAVDASLVDVASLKGGETKPVLSPSLFVGKTAAAYKVAQENPELLDSMYCYCYCSRNIGHKSLLSCFTDNHAANCGICQDQAFYAYSLAQKGYDIAQIRQAEDKKFSSGGHSGNSVR